MSLEIRLDDRLAQVELVSRDENRVKLKIDEKLYDVDIVMVEQGIYSLLMNGKSYSVELMDGDSSKKYSASIFGNSFDLEIIDAESRYLMNRKGDDEDDGGNHISSPMPGKVVKILVTKGMRVEAGGTLIIISAMKMESEYKSGKEGIIKEIHVKEGDTIEGNQLLITIE